MPKDYHYMIDIETYSDLPTAAIATMGIVRFDMKTNTLHEKFYVTIDPATCKEAGLHFSKKTLDWWKTQPNEVRKALRENNIPLKDALEQMLEFLEPKSTICCWGCFDISIIAYALHQVGLEPNWNYWDVIECRSIAKLFGKDITRDKKMKHNALQDAIDQSLYIFELFSDENS